MSTFIVAEIGQNHNGDPAIAKALIDMAAMPIYCQGERLLGINAVKFCIRNKKRIEEEPSFDRPYTGPNSFGSTYREHRLALELPIETHKELAKYANQCGLMYFASVCDPESVEEVDEFMPVYKVASRDLTNLPLLRRIKETGKPVILSCGMSTKEELEEAIKVVEKNYSVLICTSEYPTPYADAKLDWLIEFQKYPFPVGWSDHTRGYELAVVAVACGAKIIEKHITIDQTMRGTDHAGALEPANLWKMVRAIRNTEKALIVKDFILNGEGEAWNKLREQEKRILS